MYASYAAAFSPEGVHDGADDALVRGQLAQDMLFPLPVVPCLVHGEGIPGIAQPGGQGGSQLREHGV